ncbi:putative quinol monooxygenase [Chryseolinea sp. T2]|uniref:putative quinol monooxygenase n=1 Tax=Chryseolinea sp. T2 TaxID=3129255 RepID=UPI00307838CE
MSADSKLIVIAVITAIDGHQYDLRAAQEKLVAETRMEKGCELYELNQSLDDSRILIFVERWTTEADWKAHMEGSAVANFRASGAPKWVESQQLHRMTGVA